MSKMTNCNSCGHEISKNAKACPHCGAKNNKAIFQKWWIGAIVAVVVIGVIAGSGAGSDGGGSNNSNGTQQGQINTDDRLSAFQGDCGISATAEMGTDIIGQPTVSISIKNTSGKSISAIRFYAVPYDVYGEELHSIYTQNKLDTDNTIQAGKTSTRTWQFLDNDVKTVKLYVYSVYFSDGTEWGDREATKSVILKNAPTIKVEGKSGS